MNDQSLDPALLYLFAAIRNRPALCILCWQNNGLLFHFVRAGSLNAADFVATALRRMNKRRIAE
jgi:hypothetical protein